MKFTKALFVLLLLVLFSTNVFATFDTTDDFTDTDGVTLPTHNADWSSNADTSTWWADIQSNQARIRIDNDGAGGSGGVWMNGKTTADPTAEGIIYELQFKHVDITNIAGSNHNEMRYSWTTGANFNGVTPGLQIRFDESGTARVRVNNAEVGSGFTLSDGDIVYMKITRKATDNVYDVQVKTGGVERYAANDITLDDKLYFKLSVTANGPGTGKVQVEFDDFSQVETGLSSIDANFDYDTNLFSGEIELTDTSTTVDLTIDNWDWLVDGSKVSDDQNYNYATSQNQDLNICLYVEDSTDTYESIACQNVITGKWINSLWHYTETPATTTINFFSDANTEGLAIATYNWIIDGNTEGTTANYSKTNATQLTDYNACLYVANAIANDINCFSIQTTDWEPPTTFATAAQIANYSTANINITCTDNNSGCDKVYYKYNAGAWTDTNILPVDVNYSVIGTHTLSWYGVDVAGNIEDTNTLNFTITADTTAPEITFTTDIVDVGFVTDFNVGLSLYCTDNRLNDLNYIIQKSVNGTTTTLLNVQDVNAQTKLYWEALGVGQNYFIGKCIDFNGNVVQETSTPIYAMSFRLINEETGAALTDLNVVELDKLQAFTYDGNNVYDYNIYAPVTKYFIDYDNVVRFDLTYNDVSETKFSREIDFGILPDANVGVCIAPFQSFYEQFLVSSTNKDVVVYNDFAKCYNLASSTKFAYENALMVRAFTINKPYYLYTWIDDVKTLLATIDGSKASVINLDVLEFNKEEYSFEIATDTVIFKCLENSTTGICDQNTMSIYYQSLRADNTSTKFQVYNGNTLLWTYTEEDEPNEFNANWYYGTQDLNATTVLKLVLTKTSEAGVITSNEYWFNLEGQTFSGTMPASLALIFSFLVLFVGLTLVAYKYAFGWFGIALCVIAIGILSFAPGFWYIQFMQAVIVIVTVFITIVYANNARGVN